MAIKYFPNNVHAIGPHAIDRVLAQRNVKLVRGAANTVSTALDTYISSDANWHVDSIKLTFSSSAPRNYSVQIASGLKVVDNKNDRLWFQTPRTMRQEITLSPGFYTGTTLATELQTQLNANAGFSAVGVTFTVAYAEATGLFTITPSSGTLKYIQANNKQTLPTIDSTGGNLLGLNVTTEFASTVTSDTAQFGLNAEAWIIDEAGSTVISHYHDDIHVLSLDQALHLASNIANTVVTYEIAYEEIV